MKKENIKKIIAGSLLTSTLGMTTCDLFGSATIKSVEINGISSLSYQVDDNFDQSQYVLDVTMSDGTTKQINITSDMVTQLPDMSSSGIKTFKVKYEGKEYEYKINVTGYSKQEMIAKIQAFMEDYNQANPGNIKASFKANYFARFMDKTSEGSYDSDSIEINKGMIGTDTLLNHLYSSLVGGLVSSSADITIDNIVNANELKSQVDLLKILECLGTNLSNFNYPKYLIDTFMHSSDYATFVEVMTEVIVNSFGMVDDNAYNEIESFINLNLRDYINYVSSLSTENPKTFNMYEVLCDFNDIVQDYANEYCKVICQTVIDSIDESDPHVLSNFIKGLIDNNLEIFPIGEYQWIPTDPNDPQSFYTQTWCKVVNENTIALDRKLSTALYDIVLAYEEIMIHAFSETSVDMDSLISTFVEKLDAFSACENDLVTAGYSCIVLNDLWLPLSILSLNIANYQNSSSYMDYVVTTINDLGLPEMLAYYITNSIVDVSLAPENITESFNNVIVCLIHDVLDVANGKSFAPSAENYLNDICTLLDITDTQKIINYTTEWNNTGFCSIISDYLVEMFEAVETEENADLQSQLIDIVRYLENCIRTSGEKATQFSLYEIVNKIHNLADGNCEYYTNLLNDLENSDASGSNDGFSSIQYQKEIIAGEYRNWNIIRTLTDFTNSENTVKGNIDKVISEYKGIVKSTLTAVVVNTLGLDKYILVYDDNGNVIDQVENLDYTFAMQETSLLVNYIVEKYLVDELDYNYILNEYFYIVDTYANESIKVLANSTALAALVAAGKSDDVNIDFNEIFNFIKLPDEIESVDYNKLVETFWSADTYKNMFQVTKVDVKYETDSQGNISKELLEVTFSFNYDLKLTVLDADFKLNVEINFDY